jgi:hypothetical protein
VDGRLDPPRRPWPLGLRGVVLSEPVRAQLADALDPAADLPFVVVVVVVANMMAQLVDPHDWQTFGTSVDAATRRARTPRPAESHRAAADVAALRLASRLDETRRVGGNVLEPKDSATSA